MPNPDVFISPKHRLSDFDGSPNLDEKITIFEDRINGWFLEIAGQLLSMEGEGSEFRSQDFAVLAVLAVYFEMVAQYHTGKESKGKSQTQFCAGISFVFPGQYNEQQQIKIYKSLRCALYHNGLTKGAVVGRKHEKAIEFEDDLVWINPTSLLHEIRNNFMDYILILRNPANVCDRRKFQTIYDANPKL
ncbi:MAG: hypothetical protein EBZ36_13250 [Acidobacteria bacterium]|nr:hypothetical protein [Acidobacteriota bacterium]